MFEKKKFLGYNEKAIDEIAELFFWGVSKNLDYSIIHIDFILQNYQKYFQ